VRDRRKEWFSLKYPLIYGIHLRRRIRKEGSILARFGDSLLPLFGPMQVFSALPDQQAPAEQRNLEAKVDEVKMQFER